MDEDDELNEMLQRSEQELSIFRHMDDERIAYEVEMYRRRGYSKPLERLIQEDEVPDVFTREEEPIVDPQSQWIDFGRGRRVRDEVCYDDGLTEEQWLEACGFRFQNLQKKKNYALILIGSDFRL